MRILIHALSLRRFGGHERHIRSFLPALARLSPDVTYVLYSNQDFSIRKTFPNIHVRPIHIRSNLHRVWWDQFLLPRVAQQEEVDAIWCIGGFGAIRPRVKQVTFQRVPTYYCRYHLDDLSGRQKVETLLRRWLQFRVMHASECIITPTDAMRDMIRSTYPMLPMQKFQTIPHGFDSNGLAGVEALPLNVREVLDSCGQDALKVLYVGHILPYKQLNLLLEAFRKVVNELDRPLVLLLTIAREDWSEGYDAFMKQIAIYGLQESVIVLGKIPQLAIGRLYRACDIVAYPSLCESFGWPVVEATSLRIPVLAADVPVNREMAGEGALYFAHRDVESAAAQLQKLLGDEQLRNAVGVAGHAHFQRTHLEWSEYVQSCLEATLETRQ